MTTLDEDEHKDPLERAFRAKKREDEKAAQPSAHDPEACAREKADLAEERDCWKSRWFELRAGLDAPTPYGKGFRLTGAQVAALVEGMSVLPNIEAQTHFMKAFLEQEHAIQSGQDKRTDTERFFDALEKAQARIKVAQVREATSEEQLEALRRAEIGAFRAEILDVNDVAVRRGEHAKILELIRTGAAWSLCFSNGQLCRRIVSGSVCAATITRSPGGTFYVWECVVPFGEGLAVDKGTSATDDEARAECEARLLGFASVQEHEAFHE